MNDSAYFITEYWHLIEWLIGLTALVILVSSLDDVFIDTYYWIRQVWRRLVKRRRYPCLAIAKLRQPEEQHFAMMVPAWQEFDVIAKMIENTMATLEYRHFVVFIGTYQNDSATTIEADRMARRFPQVRRVTVPHDGPTCKADCLNWIVQAIFLYEQEHGMQFAGMVMHDSEDVIHPLEFKLFNYLMPKKDLVQLPVLSLERDWHAFVAGTYMDDFAEWHSKDLVVRESLTGLVPSAGVASCYSRRALAALAEESGMQPFNTDTLTEDYDFSFRLRRLGMSRQIFVKFPIEYRVRRKCWFGLYEREVAVDSLIATREYFPSTFRAAYRQRARWILGIAFQGWQEVGWRGSLSTKYLLLRDRKCLVTSFVAIFGYVLVLNVLALWAIRHLGVNFAMTPELIHPGTWVYGVVTANFFLFANRIAQRIYFVSRLYGIEQGLWAVPRMVVNNFINFAAAARAWHIYLEHLASGKKIAWDKTAHSYPSSAELAVLHQRLGELLLSWRAIGEDELTKALAEQQGSGEPLGHILLAQGAIDEETLADAIATQNQLPRAHLDWSVLPAVRTLLPESLIQQHRTLPLSAGRARLALAVDRAPSTELAGALNRLGYTDPHFFVVSESELARALALVLPHPSTRREP